ncbi:MAG: flavodoxin-dependent (E)-4-hydroxy-3-methylbut-2-enyl-diphosphate synthase [Oscillospiraceae bacterium]|nr:flavodoxin-dependent (E)-4-hydroxy-3-methylbut-2-enyl-diphosphate synthase [Oscillospiraceae bacterium]
MISRDKITIQSMTTTKTSDVQATAAQIKSLAAIGCDIIRVAVPDMASADAIYHIKSEIDIPLVADIHFDYRLAIRCVSSGADKIRINPGNIGGEDNVKKVADACRKRNIPIRIGVNSGSLERSILEKHGAVTAEAMAESVLGHAALLTKYDFDDIWLSAKASSAKLTVQTYRLLREMTKYPLHIGVTGAGTEYSGIIKNAIGIGALLLDGIGDTIRVSLTAPPEREVIAAKTILKSLGLYPGIDVISCPTCGRCGIDVMTIADEVERRLESNMSRALKSKPAADKSHLSDSLTVAVMGCSVNGPGEARQADFGIAGCAGVTRGGAKEGEGIIFARGEIIKKTKMSSLIDELMEIIYL